MCLEMTYEIPTRVYEKHVETEVAGAGTVPCATEVQTDGFLDRMRRLTRMLNGCRGSEQRRQLQSLP